jgi:hypothetical protein
MFDDIARADIQEYVRSPNGRELLLAIQDISEEFRRALLELHRHMMDTRTEIIIEYEAELDQCLKLVIDVPHRDTATASGLCVDCGCELSKEDVESGAAFCDGCWHWYMEYAELESEE